MSTLDDKLKAWREATDVEPSAELLQRLSAQVEAPAPSAALTPVKVLLAVVAVGVVAAVALALWSPVAVFTPARLEPVPVVAVPPTPAVAPTPAAPALGPDVPAQAPVAVPQPVRRPLAVRVDAGAGLADCPPRSEPLMLVGVPNADSEETREAERLLAARPLTCEGQKQPMQTLLAQRPNTAAERVRLWARQAFLCDAAPWQADFAPCDDSAWCHAPQCDHHELSCLEALAAWPEGTCTAEGGKRELGAELCRRFIRGDRTQRARIQKLSRHAWCLDAAAQKEVEWLLAHGAVPGRLEP